MTANTDGTTTTTPGQITGLNSAAQEKILQLGMQYVSDPGLTFKNPKYLYSESSTPKPNTRFLRLPEQCWNLFYRVDVPIHLFSSDKVPPEVQAQAGDMTTASMVIGVEIGKRENVYSVERHFLSVDKNNVFDTSETGSGISDWHSTP